jgi:alanyl-tRNA synthetase
VTGDQVRESFLDFFRERSHTIVPSAPLVPQNDPSLLFTNAGMVQFKQVFLAKETRPYVRAADSQKCLRISGKHNDLEQVGRDTYHHTFFEMLGNWSFGDYYKREAIGWAWELLTGVWKLPKAKLWATVHTTDDESERLWHEVTDLPRERVLRFDAENFWEMGETGPCGPCSEIHLDRGPDACDQRDDPAHRCGVNAGCARYLEIWNLVFIQYNRDASGKLSDLPARHVDTGMGFERIASVLQGARDNYGCDVLRGIITTGERLSGKRYGASERDDVSLRVIADHGRAVTFLVADGIVPSNEGRGYVLRRLLRRAARHGKLLGLDRPFLWEVVGAVVHGMGRAYPEIAQQHRHIADVVRAEEERFAATLDRGLALLASEIERARAGGAKVLAGDVAFRLYDTYGFPLDLTEDILAGECLTVDHAGFERAMEEQRTRARGAQRFVDAEAAPGALVGGGLATRFVGDRITEWESEVLGLVIGGQPTRGPVHAGTDVDVVTAETPFYAESGGQVGDHGVLETLDGATLIEVQDTQRIAPTVVAHRGVVKRGALAVGDRVRLAIDVARREASRLNHSATHLAHAALRRRLGPHVKQAGSLVTPERLRFDFSHSQAVDAQVLRDVEDEVNAQIRANDEVTTEEMPYARAVEAGALAFFGEKYGDRVTVVRMGDYSVELCGGTHVRRTGDIGFFHVDDESGVAAGVRRLEAATGAGALATVRHHEAVLADLSQLLRAPEDEAAARVEKLLAEKRELEKRITELQGKLAGGATRDVLADARSVNGITVLATRVEGLDDKGLREMADRLRERIKSGVVVLGATHGDRALLLAAVTSDLLGRYHAGNIIKRLAPLVGGGGGGRPDFAQAGGKDPGRLDEALAAAYDLVGAGSP